jgi:hypothetical protein
LIEDKGALLNGLGMDEVFVGNLHRRRSTQSRDSVAQLYRVIFLVFGSFLATPRSRATRRGPASIASD